MELSTYFLINAADTGQFERTLIVAEAGSYVSYLEGCTAPMRDNNQLHAAVVELIAALQQHPDDADKTRSRNPNIVGALALLRAALLKIFNHFRPIYGSLVATLENIRTDQSIPLNVICKRLA